MTERRKDASLSQLPKASGLDGEDLILVSTSENGYVSMKASLNQVADFVERRLLHTAKLGICPICHSLFRSDGHSFDCPLSVTQSKGLT